MFKSQRRFGKVPKNENMKKIVHNTLEFEEVYSPKANRLRPTHIGDKNRTNRCTIIKPSYKDFGQFTEILKSPNAYTNSLREQFGIDPVIPEAIEKLKELKKIICQNDTIVEDTSSYNTARGKSKVNLIEKTSSETQWQNVENTTDLYKFIPKRQAKTVPSRKEKVTPNREVKLGNYAEENFIPSRVVKLLTGREENIKPSREVKRLTSREENIIPSREVKLLTGRDENIIPSREVKLLTSREENIKPSREVKLLTSREENIIPSREVKNAVKHSEIKPPTRPFPTRIRISEVPRIKVMAEKFSMFKKDNIELRRLEEKLVCLEYDVFDADAETGKPFQRMRAFFSIKTQKGKEGENDDIAMIPSEVKRDFGIVKEDLNELNKKEIEIIDEHLPENRALLEDLKKVLSGNQVLRHKKEGSLDLMYLYEMAKRQNIPLDEGYLHNNVLSKQELDEIKEMILKTSVSSIHGVSRRKVKNRNTQGNVKDSEECEISNSLMMEIMREVKIDANNTLET